MKVILLASAALWAVLFVPWARRDALVPASANEPIFSPVLTHGLCALIGLIALGWVFLSWRRPVNSFLPVGTRQSLAYSASLMWLSGAWLTLSSCFLLAPSSPWSVLSLGFILSALVAWFTPRRLAGATDHPSWPAFMRFGMVLFVIIPLATCLYLIFQKKNLSATLPVTAIQRLQTQNLISIGVMILTTFVLARLWFRFRHLQPLARSLVVFSLILIITNLSLITTWRYQNLITAARQVRHNDMITAPEEKRFMVRPGDK